MYFLFVSIYKTYNNNITCETCPSAPVILFAMFHLPPLSSL